MVRIKKLLDLLCGVVALISLGPVLAYLDRPMLPIALLAVPAGFWCDRRERYPLSTWLATTIALAGMAFYGVQVTRDEVAIPVVHAMVVLMVIRMLTPKAGRDYLQVFVLALFILAGSSLIHLEIGFVIYLVLLIFAVTLGLVLLTVYVTDQKLSMTRSDLGKLIKVGLVLPGVSLLLMMVFFFVLPRTRQPLWNFLNPKTNGVVGLAESVQPGSFSRISTNQALAFRAEGPELAPEERYWRALILNHPEGGQWVRVPPPPESSLRVEGPAPVTFMIYPEPRSDRYLVTLDRPLLATGFRNEQTVDQMYIARSALDHRFRFEVRSSPGASLKVQGKLDRDFYLQVPAEVTPRMRRLAEDIRNRSDDINVRINALAEFFRQQGLSYAQEDLPTGPEAIDSFLFDKKQGYCEFFASAYVTLARLSGIPARLVGGYFGGDYNTLGGYYLVSEKAAHVWVEIFTADHAWQRVDPSQWAINAETTLGARDRDALGPLRQLADSLNYHWVQAVVVFDLEQQLELFHEAGNQLRDLRSLKAPQGWWKAVVGLLLGAAVAVGAFSLRRKPKEVRLLENFRNTLEKRYGQDSWFPGAGLQEVADRLDNDACHEFARIYYGAIFRDRALTTEEFHHLKNLLKRI